MLTKGATMPLKSLAGGEIPSALRLMFVHPDARDSSGCHASICEPPTADWMRPMGTAELAWAELSLEGGAGRASSVNALAK